MLVEVGVSNAVDVIGPVREVVAAERDVPLLKMAVVMGTKLIVPPSVVEIAMTVVSIMILIPIMVSNMAPVVLIKTAAVCDAVVIVDTRKMQWFWPFPAEPVLESRIGRGRHTFAAGSAAPSAFRLRRNPGMALW
jgi:hypothetical protein